MIRKLPLLPFYALACLICCTSLLAEDKDARLRLTGARSMYYTPATAGLKSFHCEGTIDWKTMLTRLSGTEVSDENAALKFLKTVHLSVTDELKGTGSMGWTATGDPPAAKEAAVNQIRDGLQTSVAGFFQSWNAYMNGSMVPIPDSSVTITKSGEGVHLSGVYANSKFDEDYDKNMLLTQVEVVNPNMKVLATPTYINTPDGLIVTTVSSEVHQPPDAPPSAVVFRIDYAEVDKFQLPSRVIFDIKNTGVIEIGFSSCKISVADWAASQPSTH